MLNLDFLPKEKKCERKTSIRNCLRGSELHLKHGSTFGVYGEGGIWMPGSKGPPAGLNSIEKSPSPPPSFVERRTEGRNGMARKRVQCQKRKGPESSERRGWEWE